MSWQLVFRTPALSTTTTRTTIDHIGQVVGIPDPFTSHVMICMHPGGELRSVHLAWSDRPEGFASFLQTCTDSFRLHVGICAQSVVAFSLYANVTEVRRQFEDEGFLRGEPFLVALLQKFLPDATLPRADVSFCTLPTTSADTDELRTEWTLPLRSTQRTSVDWLACVEANVLSYVGNTVAYKTGVPITPNVEFDPRCGLLRSTLDEIDHVRFRGAVLANEVGSGKTCCILRLIAEETPLANMANAVVHKHNNTLKSPATVVVCPVGMQQHWRDEARKFAPHMRVLTLTSVKEMKLLTLRSLMEACDLLITTPTWIRSKSNTEATDLIVGNVLNLEPDRRIVRKSLVPASRALCKRETQWSELPAVLNLITFRRCVVDEAHDIIGPSAARRERLRACHAVKALVWIGLTATPNVSDTLALHEWAHLLLDVNDDAIHPCLAQQMESQLIRSFSRTEEHRTATLQTVHRVVLSAFERAILESHSGDVCRLHTTHVSSLGGASDVVRTVQLCCSTGAYYHDRVHSVEDVVQSLRSAREEQLVELRAHGPDTAETRGRIAAIDAQRRFIEHMFAQFSTSASDNAAECPVCLERDVAPGAWVAMGCGHVLCRSCYDGLKSRNLHRKCPVCRDDIQRTFRVSVNAQGEMLRSRGAKLEATVALVRSLTPTKVVVVATWKPLLISLKEELNKTCVLAEILEGPSTRRAAILRRFCDGDTATLLLMSHGGFEGHDLSAAAHVIFMHALAEPADEALRIEHQVLGRVKRDEVSEVHVHYMVATDTEEERLWEAQHKHAQS